MSASNRLETAANIAIVSVSVLVATVSVWKFVIPHATGNSATTVPLGRRIELPNFAWSSTPRAAVLVLSTQCHFCIESAPFFRTLIELAHRRKIPVIAVFPQQKDDALKFLSRFGLATDNVFSVPLKSIGVAGTPTVLIVDGQGSVADGWVGMIRPGDAARYLQKL